MDDREAVELVKKAYERWKTEYLKEEKLLGWLKENGLSLKEAMKAIDTASRQGVIRFCYTESSPEDRGKLVPHYKKLTEEDQMPPELEVAIVKRLIEKDHRMEKAKVANMKRKKKVSEDMVP